MADSVSLKAALSEDGNLAAVPVPSSSGRRVIQVYQVENGLLQTTLTAKEPSNLRAAATDKPARTFDQVLFCGKNHVVALSKNSAASAGNDQNNNQVFIWDLSRGGVVAHSIADESNHKHYLDAATTADSLYLLVAVSSSSSLRSSASGMGDDSDEEKHADKLQVHQYDPSTGRLMRKIKCGKCGGRKSNSEFGLALHLTSDGGKIQLLIRNGTNSHHEAFRVLDAETGSKVGKHKYRDDKKKEKKEGTGGYGIKIASPVVAIPRINSVALYNIETSKWIKTLPTENSNPQVQLWKTTEAPGAGSESLLLIDQELYKCSSNSVELLSKVHSDRAIALLPRSAYQVAAVLYNPLAVQSSVQIQLIDWGTGDSTDNEGMGQFQSRVTIHWETPGESSDAATAAAAESGSSKKRSAESMTVLGAGQAGSESISVSERKSHKKHKEDDTGDHDEEMDVVDDPSMKDMTIADRLKKLTDAMDTKDGDDEDSSDDERSATKGKRGPSNSFVPKRATTESLTQLLGQALQGGDDGLLELALSVKDSAVLRETFKGLDSFSIEILLTKLTTRLASKPQRAEDLAFWLSHVLQSGRVRKISQLQPLKNLLQERIEAFPHLLRLEGRLSMIKSESSKEGSSSNNRLTAN